jgi:hypothetical protein
MPELQIQELLPMGAYRTNGFWISQVRLLHGVRECRALWLAIAGRHLLLAVLQDRGDIRQNQPAKN